MIVGELAVNVETYSLYPGESAGDYVRSIEENVKCSEERIFLVVDVVGGSVYNEFFTLTKYANVRLFTGMNLPLVLELVTNGEDFSDEDIDAALTNARDGICCFYGNRVQRSTDDTDF